MRPPSPFTEKWVKKKKQLSKQLMEEGELYLRKNSKMNVPKKFI